MLRLENDQRRGRTTIGVVAALILLMLTAFSGGLWLSTGQPPWLTAQQVWQRWRGTTSPAIPLTPPTAVLTAAAAPAEIPAELRERIAPLTETDDFRSRFEAQPDPDPAVEAIEPVAGKELLEITIPAEVQAEQLVDAGLVPAVPAVGQQHPTIIPIADERPVRKQARNNSAESLKLGGDSVKTPQPLVPREPRGPIDLTRVKKLLDEGNEFMAYQLLSEWYFDSPAERPKFQKLLDELATQIYFSPQPHVEPPYEIQPGDELRKISRKYQLSWQYVAKVNNVDPRKIRAGKQLKVFQGPFGAVVDMSDYELTIHLRGLYVRRYKVGLGKNNSTPIGEFVVRDKLENPKYYGSDGEVREPDDPKNPLGERWIDIGDSYGIHGTIDPNSIGKSESKGCVRMLNGDVEEVYDLLSVGSPVRIQR